MNALWKEPPGPEMHVGPAELHVWRGDLRAVALHPDTLSEEERTRAERFLSETARRRYLASHLALRNILSRYLQIAPAAIVVVQLERQKPYLACNAGAPTVSFSLSRSEELCLVAVASCVRVGVDLEWIAPDRCEPGMAEQILTSEELAAFAAVAAPERLRVFLRSWTRKEAYAKCIGLGLAADLTHASVGLTEETVTIQGIVLSSFVPQEGFVATWAAEDALRPSFWKWPHQPPG